MPFAFSIKTVRTSRIINLGSSHHQRRSGFQTCLGRALPRDVFFGHAKLQGISRIISTHGIHMGVSKNGVYPQIVAVWIVFNV